MLRGGKKKEEDLETNTKGRRGERIRVVVPKSIKKGGKFDRPKEKIKRRKKAH